jgi:hypothetical protein
MLTYADVCIQQEAGGEGGALAHDMLVASPHVLLHHTAGVFGLKLQMYEALSYQCMGPYATSVWGLKLLVYEALSY